MSKLRRIGFTRIERGEELTFSIDHCAEGPLFTTELVEIMRRHIPHERWDRVARSIVLIASKPA